MKKMIHSLLILAGIIFCTSTSFSAAGDDDNPMETARRLTSRCSAFEAERLVRVMEGMTLEQRSIIYASSNVSSNDQSNMDWARKDYGSDPEIDARKVFYLTVRGLDFSRRDVKTENVLRFLGTANLCNLLSLDICGVKGANRLVEVLFRGGAQTLCSLTNIHAAGSDVGENDVGRIFGHFARYTALVRQGPSYRTQPPYIYVSGIDLFISRPIGAPPAWLEQYSSGKFSDNAVTIHYHADKERDHPRQGRVMFIVRFE